MDKTREIDEIVTAAKQYRIAWRLYREWLDRRPIKIVDGRIMPEEVDDSHMLAIVHQAQRRFYGLATPDLILAMAEYIQ